MKWTIMILTQPPREKFLARLMARLSPQVAWHPEEVEVFIKNYDPKRSLGENRQLMVEEAQGEYVCSIDDDDLVSYSYVEKILPLLDGIDYVGFMVQTYIDGVKLRPTSHSLRHEHWFEDQNGAYRDISHLNPMRRELALKAHHTGGYDHDARWAADLRKLNLVTTEHFLDEVMYYYYYRTRKDDSYVPAVSA